MMSNVFFQAFFIVFLAEMGDKSQLLMIALSSEYKLRDLILGTVLASFVLCGLAVSVGAFFGNLLPQTAISIVAGVAFLLFAILSANAKGERETVKQTRSSAILAVFGTYFLAELGDKTQLSALALSASANSDLIHGAITVFLGASLALIAADALGIVVGVMLKKRLPSEFFSAVSAVLFFACGVLRLMEGFFLLFSNEMAIAIFATLIPSLTAAVLMILSLIGRKRIRM